MKDVQLDGQQSGLAAANKPQTVSCKLSSSDRAALEARAADHGMSVNAYLQWLITTHLNEETTPVQGKQPDTGIAQQPAPNRPTKLEALLSRICELAEETNGNVEDLQVLISDRLGQAPVQDEPEDTTPDLDFEALTEQDKKELIASFYAELKKQAVVIPYPALPGADKIASVFASLFSGKQTPDVLQLMRDIVANFEMVGFSFENMTKDRRADLKDGYAAFTSWKDGLARGEYDKLNQSPQAFSPEAVKLEGGKK